LVERLGEAELGLCLQAAIASRRGRRQASL
jgi:hypothetical protein